MVEPPPRAPAPVRGLIGQAPSRKRSVSHRAILKRGRLIRLAKRVLPATALILLSLVVLWPEFSRMTQAGRNAVDRMNAQALSGELVNAHYRGVDERGRPYTVTAISGQQISPEQVDLAKPKADMTLEGGDWVLLQAERGVYMQHKAQLDLSGDVTVYRDDGTFLHTPVATMDLKTGFASGAQNVSVEGPFGTLDATGFTLGDKGRMIQFNGPARLIMNARKAGGTR